MDDHPQNPPYSYLAPEKRDIIIVKAAEVMANAMHNKRFGQPDGTFEMVDNQVVVTL